MQRLVRLALMVLLAIALPMQGFAAATMISCGAGQHEHAPGQGLAHSHAGAGAVHPHSHASEADSHAGAFDHSAAGKTDIAKSGMHKCSACASCCTSAAVPSRAIVFSSVKLPDHYAPLAARSVPAPVTEGLERPPRAVLA